MKALSLLPKEIKKAYDIKRIANQINIHDPAYINVDMDSRFRIETDGITYSVANSKVKVNLWIDCKIMHTTVFS